MTPEEMLTDRNGHPLKRGDFVKVYPLNGERPKVLGRILGMCDETTGKGTKVDPFRARRTYSVACGIRAEKGKESRGSVVVVERWKDGVEYIGADRVQAGFVAFGVWVP